MIAVTGSTGFIGKRLVQKLIDSGFSVRCIVRRKIPLASPIKNLSFFYADLNSETLWEALKGADTVIHLAALLSSKEKEKAMLVNVDGTRNLLEAAKKAKIKKFIFISSELAKYPEKNFYGKTKLLGEELVKKSGIPFVILRPAIVFGPHDNKNLSVLIKKLRQLPFGIVIGKGDYFFQPVFVDDVADAIIASMQREAAIGKTLDIAGEPIQFREIIQTIFVEFQMRKPILGIPKKFLLFCAAILEKLPLKILTRERIESISKNREMNIEPAKKILGFKPKSFRDSLILTMKEENWI